MSFWTPNIDGKGRAIRLAGAVALLIGAVAAGLAGWTLLAVILGVSAAFVGFEAARGWCVLRACKIRTPF